MSPKIVLTVTLTLLGASYKDVTCSRLHPIVQGILHALDLSVYHGFL